jgi:predicted Ser/Thr protein kinase
MRCPSCQTELDGAPRVCPSCGEDLAGRSAAVTIEDARALPERDGAAAGRATSADGERVPGDAVDDEEVFTPGEIVAERYRILRVLGVGGMGRVYHAYDLKLGQAVALKVLRRDLARHGGCVERLRAEVRIARSIAHPNVCRVYDLSEHDGIAFLSMEYIDGEDLASLLRRIGRLTPERAIEAARQLVAAIQAAHDRGVLHRDLKPANVMIDGQGNLRITDFGIAAAMDKAQQAEGASPGTPAYMAPEVLSGGKASVQSDLFALGLILYEMFTGRPVFDAKSMTELFQQHRREVVAPASSVVEMHPELDRAILWCLRRDPSRRPPSALAVLAALPGGDPLRAALAAGETPSPELVAASGGSGRIPVRTVGLLVLLAAAALAAVFSIAPFTKLTAYVETPNSADVLAYESRRILDRLEYPTKGRSEAWGFEIDQRVLAAERRRAEEHGEGRWWYRLSEGFPEPIRFFYRSAPWSRPLIANRLPGRVTWVDPAQDPEPILSQPWIEGDENVDADRPWDGSVRMRLTPTGDLRELYVVPGAHDLRAAVGETPTDEDVERWRRELFDLAGLDTNYFDPVDPELFGQHAWRAFFGDKAADESVHVELAMVAGRPAVFRVATRSIRMMAEDSDLTSWLRKLLNGLINFGVSIAALVLAGISIARGSYDRVGGFRIAVGTLAIVVVANMLHGNEILSPSGRNIDQLYNAVARGLLIAGHTWLFYVAVESRVRRIWPEVLIGWVRLVGGRVRDPLVGRSVLIGLAAGSFGSMMQHLDRLVPQVLEGRDGALPIFFVPATIEMMTGGWLTWASSIEGTVLIFRYTLFMVTMLLGLRLLFRSRWLSTAAFVLLQVLIYAGSAETSLWSIPLYLIVAIAGAWILVRHGVLAAFVAGWTWSLLYASPLELDPTHPSFASTLIVLGSFALLTLFGSLVAVGVGHARAHAVELSRSTPAAPTVT